MKLNILILAALALGSVTMIGHAADIDIGVSVVQQPELDGERMFVADVTLPAGASLDQRPVSQTVAANRSRLVLQYTTSPTSWSPARRIVGQAEGLGTGRYRVRANLLQGQPLPATGTIAGVPASVYPLNPIYYENPVTITHGSNVRFRWVLERGTQVALGDAHEFTMPHPLVFALLGDSFGAGEGAPVAESTFTSQVRWDHKPSHRSTRNGHRQAVINFRRAHPELWIEFVHVAQSGATITPADGSAAGLVREYRSNRDIKIVPLFVQVGGVPIVIPIPVPLSLDVRVPDQVGQVENWLASNAFERTHAVLLSAGGNDAGFGEAILGAVFGTLSFAFGDTLRWFRENLEAARVANRVHLRPALGDVIRPDHLLWTNYPNPSVDEQQGHSAVNVDLSANAALMLLDASIGSDDLANAHLLLTEELNPAVAEMCAEFNVDGSLTRCHLVDVESVAHGHGINAVASQRWFNTFQDSQDEVEGAVDGAVHPNRVGQGLFVGPLLARLDGLYDPVRGSEYRAWRAERQQAARDAARVRAKEKARAAIQDRQSSQKEPARVAERRALQERLEAASQHVTPELLKQSAGMRAQRLSRGPTPKRIDPLDERLRQPSLRMKALDAKVAQDLAGRLTAARKDETAELLQRMIADAAKVRKLDHKALQAAISKARASELSREQAAAKGQAARASASSLKQ